MSVYGQRDWGWICPKCQASNAPTLQHCPCSHQPQRELGNSPYVHTPPSAQPPHWPTTICEAGEAYRSRENIRGNPIKPQPFLEGENPLCQ